MTYSVVPKVYTAGQPQHFQPNLSPEQVLEQLSRFAGWMLVEKSIKKSTIKLYCKMIRRVIELLGSLDPLRQQLENHIVWMHMEGYSENYIRNVTVAIESYTEFMGDRQVFGKPKRKHDIVKDTLTEAEISVILAACKNIREKAIISTLAYSGARNAEICNLRVSDIDFGNNRITIIDGKGGKSRVVNVSGDCIRVILEYLAQFPRGNDSYLFTTLRQGRRYTTWAMRRLIKTVAGRTFIEKKVYPHLFRHSLACNMLARGANLLTIKEQLGHSYIETTMIYIRSRADRVAAEYRMYEPSYL